VQNINPKDLNYQKQLVDVEIKPQEKKKEKKK